MNPYENPNTLSLDRVQVVVHSIGMRHPGALDLVGAHDGLFFNLGTARFRNPHENPRMKDLTGLDDPVRDYVLRTPGMMQQVERIAETAKAALFSYANRRRQLVHVTLACRGGRHRSVAAAESVAEYLRTDEIGVEVEHHHVRLPVLLD